MCVKHFGMANIKKKLNFMLTAPLLSQFFLF